MIDNNPQFPTLSGKQLKAIPVILSSRNITEGCKKARISRDIFYDWIKNPIFKDEFERQRQEIIDSALHGLKVSASDAVEVLRALLKADQECVRLKTATAILDHIEKFIELETIQKRLDDIERRVME
jgi:hypothetical protein